MAKYICLIILGLVLIAAPQVLTKEVFSLTCKDKATNSQTFRADNLDQEPKQVDDNSYNWTMNKVLVVSYNLDNSEHCVINKHRIQRDIPPWR